MARSELVLHVVESYGGGVASAVAQYVRSTPDFSHVLIRRVRSGDYVSDTSEGVFREVLELPRGHFSALASLNSHIGRLSPAVIHAHSSFAGAYVRLLPRSALKGSRVVYTPHCYAFERTDLAPLWRQIYLGAERMLSRRTSVIAGCSQREVSLAKRLNPRTPGVFVPNTAGRSGPPQARGLVRTPDVVGIGRLAPQKDPTFFANTFQALATTRPEVTAAWIGGGTPEQEHEMTRLSVEVTGWRPREETLQLLEGAKIYLHTAAWEGFPMSLLEANFLGVPVVARSIAALEGAPSSWVGSTPANMARIATGLLSSEDLCAENVATWREWLRDNTPQTQRERLLSVYRVGAF